MPKRPREDASDVSWDLLPASLPAPIGKGYYKGTGVNQSTFDAACQLLDIKETSMMEACRFLRTTVSITDLSYGHDRNSWRKRLEKTLQKLREGWVRLMTPEFSAAILDAQTPAGMSLTPEYYEFMDWKPTRPVIGCIDTYPCMS